jgi:hypothetical protein
METDLDLPPGQVAILIGVDHKIQHFVKGIPPDDPRIKLRLRFHDFLAEITQWHWVDLICEQAKHGVESIAETLAQREDIRYRNIEIPSARREAILPLDASVGIPGSDIPPEQKTAWNHQREAHMVYELFAAIADARFVIVICGVIHMRALGHALQSKFIRVEQYDMTRLGWFDKSFL